MPIYEYECKKCKYKFEQLQMMTDKPSRVCPKCKNAKLIKLISNTSFQLKGTGWYVTDFKNKNTLEQKTATGNNQSLKNKENKTPESIEKKSS
jgi:putative FmdB family regulatory protein